MYFILAILFMLSVILSIIFYGVIKEVLIPKFLASIHADHLSRVIRRLMIEIVKDCCAHLQTICEPDGDEPFEPFLDSPLHTCPPTEFYFSPPKEEVGTSVDGNNNHGVPPRRRRPRVVLPQHAPNAPVPPIRRPAQQQDPNPIAANRLRRHVDNMRRDVGEQERILEDNERRINGVEQLLGRVMQLRRIRMGILSPPPQENEGERFQFD